MARRPFDFYETAPWQVDALVDHLPELGGLILCPCVGDGSLMRQLQKRLPMATFVTNDIDHARKADAHFDMTTAHGWNDLIATVGHPDWIVENFPFNVEKRILEYALQVRNAVGVVAMARNSFTEPTKDRGPWLAANPHQKRITLERYSFTRNGKSDMATTEWLVWAHADYPVSGPYGVSAYGYRPCKQKKP